MTDCTSLAFGTAVEDGVHCLDFAEGNVITYLLDGQKSFGHAVMEGTMAQSEGRHGPAERGPATDFLIVVTTWTNAFDGQAARSLVSG